MRKVYLASFYDDFPRMQEIAKQLETKDIVNTARWVRGEHAAKEGQLEDAAFNRRMATEDWEDLRAADMLLFFNEDPSRGRGGRWVELGISIYGLRMPVVVIGQRSNVFCYAAYAWLSEWHEGTEQTIADLFDVIENPALPPSALKFGPSS